MSRAFRALPCFAALLGAVVVPAADARAQTASEIAMARQWFADGLVREEKGDFAPALDLFRRAAQVKKTPQIVYHVGFCESRNGALVEALVDLESAVALARGAQMDNVVSAAQSELSDVHARIPSLDVRVSGDAAPARFVVDGSAIALSMLRTPMPLDPGDHTITLEFASGASATKTVKLAEKDARTLDVVAPAAAPVAAVVAPVSSAPSEVAASSSTLSPDRPAHASSAAGWALTGVGGAATIAGVVLLLSAQGKESTLHSACPSRVDCDPSLQSTYDTAKTLDAAGLIVGGVGIVAAGVGVSMVLLRPSESTSAALSITPRGVDLTARF